MLTQAKVKEYFNYNPETGVLTWKITKSNRSPAGTIINYLNSAGYVIVSVDSKHYRAHRIIFLWMTNKWPEEIDHKDHVRHNNIWTNLREVNRQTQSKNTSHRKDNTSGLMGVRWETKRSKWLAYITINKRPSYLGRFSDKFDAICARKSAEYRHNFHENHGK